MDRPSCTPDLTDNAIAISVDEDLLKSAELGTNMVSYLIRRVLLIIPTLVLISVLSFIIMEAPPGDFVTAYIEAEMQAGSVGLDTVEDELRRQWGLDQPLYVRYLKWVSNLSRGNLGYSLYWRAPVKEIIAARFLTSMSISLSATLFVWLVGFPIGIYSSTHQYSVSDRLWSLVGFLGLSIPDFLLALILMYSGSVLFGLSIGGLFSAQYLRAAWSIGKVIDLLQHVWIPIIVIGTAGTAGLIRIIRANLLDELGKSYVEMARSKGLSERRLVLKYPVRIAINPFISSIGWVLPGMISGEVIVSVVLGLPTAGPIFLRALRMQDMQLAGAYLILISVFTVVGVLLSDILLAIVDPRIRYA